MRGAKVIALTAAGVFTLAAVTSIIGFAAGWWSETSRSASAGNANAQTTALIEAYTSLEATAGNTCDATNAAPGDGDPLLVEDPAFAYAATYRRIKATYDRRMANFFEAGIVRRYPVLAGYPRIAPTLAEMKMRVC